MRLHLLGVEMIQSYNETRTRRHALRNVCRYAMRWRLSMEMQFNRNELNRIFMANSMEHNEFACIVFKLSLCTHQNSITRFVSANLLFIIIILTMEFNGEYRRQHISIQRTYTKLNFRRCAFCASTICVATVLYSSTKGCIACVRERNCSLIARGHERCRVSVNCCWKYSIFRSFSFQMINIAQYLAISHLTGFFSPTFRNTIWILCTFCRSSLNASYSLVSSMLPTKMAAARLVAMAHAVHVIVCIFQIRKSRKHDKITFSNHWTDFIINAIDTRATSTLYVTLYVHSHAVEGKNVLRSLHITKNECANNIPSL